MISLLEYVRVRRGRRIVPWEMLIAIFYTFYCVRLLAGWLDDMLPGWLAGAIQLNINIQSRKIDLITFELRASSECGAAAAAAD